MSKIMKERVLSENYWFNISENKNCFVREPTLDDHDHVLIFLTKKSENQRWWNILWSRRLRSNHNFHLFKYYVQSSATKKMQDFQMLLMFITAHFYNFWGKSPIILFCRSVLEVIIYIILLIILFIFYMYLRIFFWNKGLNNKGNWLLDV